MVNVLIVDDDKNIRKLMKTVFENAGYGVYLAEDGKKALDALAIMKFERQDPGKIMGEISKTLYNMHGAKLLAKAGKNIKEISAILDVHEYRAGLIVRAANTASYERLSRIVALAARADAMIKSSYADYSPIEWLISAL